MKISTLAGKIQEVIIEVPGETPEDLETVTVHYRPGALTLGTADDIKGLQDSPWEFESIFAMLKPMLVDWDLEEDILDAEGNPTGEVRQLGVGEEDIKKVPLPFLGQLLAEIGEGMKPGPRTSVISEEPSLRAVP